MNVKKMFASLAGVLMLAQAAAPMVTGAATYSDELQGAYDYAYSKGITTMTSIDNANMYGELTRGQLSKMISQWAEKEMWVKADETASCSFSDASTAEGDLATWVVKACQMGLMGQGINAFRPNDKVTRGEFGTVLSRAIWGDKYNQENPFYAKHLQALKDAGIMTKIEEPNSLEIRGWVMLMLQRAAETVSGDDECNDPAVLLACALGSTGCPAKCQKDGEDGSNTWSIVKSGDLSISATPAEGKKVVRNGATSYLDTITFKASEAITLNSVTIERYGFSSYSDIDAVWLENADGVQITNEKSLSSSKDSVTLSLKKDYKELRSEDTVTIAIRTVGTGGTSVGFKVIAIDSSAKNVDLSNYSPYLYDMIDYSWNDVTITAKGRDTTYHYNADEVYEIARFQTKASNAAISVNGFTLKNEAASRLDLDKYVSKIRVSLWDGTELKNVKYTANKDDELVISFDAVEIGINKNAIFVVEAGFADLDRFSDAIKFVFDWSNDLRAVEWKTQVPVTVKRSDDTTVTTTNKVELKTYTFEGGKIEVTNTKLSDNIDASAWATDVVIGQGKITVPESIKLNDFGFTITTDWSQAPRAVIETFKMVVDGDEYEAKLSGNTVASGDVYRFSNVVIDNSSDIQFIIDIKDITIAWTPKLTVAGSFDRTNLANSGVIGRYEDSRQSIKSTDFAGSISLSNIKVQAAKWSLTNNSTKDVEFLNKQTSRKTIFDGTYTASKQDVYLNGFAVTDTTYTATSTGNLLDNITYYLSIDGKEVGSFDYVQSSWTTQSYVESNGYNFSVILVKKWEKVAIKLEANVNVTLSWNDDSQVVAPELLVIGSDKDGNTAWFASELTAKIKVVKAGSVTVSESVVTNAKSVVVKDANVNLARFIVKSSKNTDGMTLDSFVLSGTSTAANGLSSSDIRVRIDGQEIDSDDIDADTTSWVISVRNLSEDITSAGLDVEVILKTEALAHGIYSYTLTSVNENSNPGTKFSKNFVASLASIKSQRNNWDASTTFTFNVEKDSNDTAITDLQLYVKNGTGYAKVWELLSTVEDDSTIEIANTDSVRFIEALSWWCADASIDSNGAITWTNCTIVTKDDFRDFFRVGDSYAQIFRTK